MTISNATLQIQYGSYSVNQLNVGSLSLAGGATLEAHSQYQADNGDIGFQNDIAVSGTNTVYAYGGSLFRQNNWLEGGMTGGTRAYMYLSNGSQYGNVYASGHAIILSGGTWSGYLGTINAVERRFHQRHGQSAECQRDRQRNLWLLWQQLRGPVRRARRQGALNSNGMSGGVWQIGNLGTSTTYSGVISGSASLAKVGTGMLTLTASSTYTGGTTIGGGTLAIAGAGVLGGGNYAVAIANSGTLSFSTSSNQTLGSQISGPGTLNQLGSGVLTLAASGLYAGGTVVNAGTLKLGVANALPYGANAGNLALLGGSLDLAGFAANVNGLSGTGTVTNSAAGPCRTAHGRQPQRHVYLSPGPIQCPGGYIRP